MLQKKKCRKAIFLSVESFQIPEEKREVNSKGKIYPMECTVPEKRKER